MKYRIFLITLFATLILLCTQHVLCQSSLYIFRNDGSETNSWLISQAKITFTGSNLLLFNGASTSSIPLSSINKVLFMATSTKVNVEHSADNLMVYPNPVTDMLYLKNLNAENLTVRIFSIDGRTLITQQLSSDQLIVNVTTLPRGFYFLKTNSQTVSFIRK